MCVLSIEIEAKQQQLSEISYCTIVCVCVRIVFVHSITDVIFINRLPMNKVNEFFKIRKTKLSMYV